MKWEFTINMHLRRSNGAVHDRDAAPAAPPATRCCHQKATHNVRHRLAIGVSSVFNCTSKQTQQNKHSVGLDLNFTKVPHGPWISKIHTRQMSFSTAGRCIFVTHYFMRHLHDLLLPSVFQSDLLNWDGSHFILGKHRGILVSPHSNQIASRSLLSHKCISFLTHTSSSPHHGCLYSICCIIFV